MKNKYLVFIGSVLFDFFAGALSLFLSFKAMGLPVNLESAFLFDVSVWPALLVLSFYIFKIYSVLWRFSRLQDILRLFVGITVGVGAMFICQMAVFGKSFNLSAALLTFFFTFILTALYRLTLKSLITRSAAHGKKVDGSSSDLSGNIMIIGAGAAASMVINEMHEHRLKGLHFKCVIDDDAAKKNTYISGVKVYGDRNSIIEAAQKFQINTILFAIPSCDSKNNTKYLTSARKQAVFSKRHPQYISL